MKKVLICAVAACALSAFCETKTRDKVVIVPAHPDDLIACLGFCHLAHDVYDIHVIDVTHGERGLGPAGYKDGTTAKTRTQEEENVVKSFGGTLHWLNEIDGEAYATRESCEALAKLLKEINPRAIIAHWPVDIHTDHVMSGAIALRATFLAGLNPEFYFMEQTYQTKRFEPDWFVDFTPVAEKKWESLRMYKCQYRDGSMEMRQKTCALHYGLHTAAYGSGTMCEVFCSLLPPMQGTKSIFADFQHYKPALQDLRFQGARP